MGSSRLDYDSDATVYDEVYDDDYTLEEYVALRLQERKQGVATQFRPLAVGTTPFHFAVKNGNLEIVKILTFLFKDKNESLEFKDTEGNSILHIACQAGHLEIVKFLWEHLGCHKMFTSIAHYGHRQTPLDMVCDRGHVQVIIALLEEAEKLNINLAEMRDNKGKSPLDLWFSKCLKDERLKKDSLKYHLDSRYFKIRLRSEGTAFKIFGEEAFKCYQLFKKLYKQFSNE